MRLDTKSQMSSEIRRLKAALSAIHDRLHADDVDGAHELCECALSGVETSQKNLSVSHSASAMDFAARFNGLSQAHQIRACCIMALPSSTLENAISLQICGDVAVCKLVEPMLRGFSSTYMGDHAAKGARRGT